MKLLIDGYNFIPAVPELRRTLRADLEASREALLELLRAYRRSAEEPLAITVVFDGKGRPGGEKAARAGGIAVLFSRNETADDLLLRLLRGGKRGAVLVTSDRALRAAAEALGAAVMRAGEFAGRLLQARGMEETGGTAEEKEAPRRALSTKKKGNPRRLPKKERIRNRRLGKL